jgi:MoxR-like ATPase
MTTTAKIRKAGARKAKTTTDTNPLVAKMRQMQREAADIFVGRDEVAHVLTLALTAKANALLLGVPGTAKTAVVKMLAGSFVSKDEFFSTLLTKFTTPKEIFGPTDLDALKQSKLRYRTKGYFPAAKVAVLDEIWKASSAILNSLLTGVNEKEFQNGDEWVKMPLRMAVGMSNEYPEDATALAAIYDRFPLKLRVGYLDADTFTTMLRSVRDNGTAAGISTKLTDDELAEIDRQVEAVDVPNSIIEQIAMIRQDLNAKNVMVSDRRYVVCLNILKAAAWLAGRDRVKSADLSVLSYVCWNNDDDAGIIGTILPEYMAPITRELGEVMDAVYEARKRLLDAANVQPDGSYDRAKTTSVAAQVRVAVTKFIAQFDAVAEECAEDDDDRLMVAECRDKANEVLDLITGIGTGKTPIEALANLDIYRPGT